MAKGDGEINTVTCSGDIVVRREPEGKDHDSLNDEADEYLNEKNSVGAYIG